MASLNTETAPMMTPAIALLMTAPFLLALVARAVFCGR